MENIAFGIGLILALEGLLYAIFPAKAKHWAKMILDLKPDSIRWTGLACAILGTLIIWLCRGGEGVL